MAETALETAPATIPEWNESLIRQLVDMVKVISVDKIEVFLCDGVKVERDMVE